MVKVDFHTHSLASPDGALSAKDYQRALEQGRLHCVAVTDHNTIVFAQALQARLGTERVIVGEEITTTEGELVGLYLHQAISAGMSAAQTAEAIHAQGGLVYVPHPFETVREGVTRETLDTIASQVDIIEVHNGRAVFQNFAAQAIAWAVAHQVPGAAGSDAHGPGGWGHTYTCLPAMPARDALCAQLAQATYTTGFPGIRGLLYPKINRLRKRIHYAD